MTERKILAFYSPYPRAGKTTACDGITSPHGVRRCSFADPVKGLVSALYSQFHAIQPPTITAFMFLPPLPNCRASNFMEAFELAGESVWREIWVEFMRRHIKAATEEFFLIDDLQTPDEYEMLRKEGARIVRITVPGRKILWRGRKTGRLEKHLYNANFDAELENTMDGLDAFHEKVRTLLERVWA